ncbi:hypothetical protein [Streptomyces syringium]|uniref:hypothetical protein n=1 Tax=Streptomyces syringium TaxID=76729 RepID=UPI0037D5F0FD
MPKKKNARKKAAAWDEARWAERRRLVRQEALHKVQKGRSGPAGEEGHALSRALEDRLAAFREKFQEPARVTGQEFGDVGAAAEAPLDVDPLAEAADLLEPLVGSIVECEDPRMALRVHVGLERISDLEGPEVAGYFGATFVTVVFGWLVGAREAGLAPREAGRAVEWIRDAFGADAERAVLMLAGLIGHPDARDGTVDDAMDELGDAFLPAALWLVAGVVATAGGGDTAWLRQFDPAPAG